MSRALTVCFAPFDAGNPYQRLLAGELRLLGAEVQLRKSLKGLCARVGDRERVDVVHLHWLPTVQLRPAALLKLLVFFVRIWLLRARGCRLVWTAHNLRHHEAAHPWAERWLVRAVARSAARIIAHSRSAQQLVARECGLDDAGRIAVVPHGHYCDAYPNTLTREEARRALHISDDRFVLLFFGNIRPYKGVPELIAAYQQVGEPASTLLIAGKAQPAVAADIARASTAHAPIRLAAGFISDDAVQQYMNASDVVVLPYRDILTSGAVILAMSFGRACIAPAIDGITDVLDEHGAFLYDPQDPDGLRAAIEAAMRVRDRLPAMGDYNRRRAKQWSWDLIARQTLAVYAEALGCPEQSKAVVQC